MVVLSFCWLGLHHQQIATTRPIQGANAGGHFVRNGPPACPIKSELIQLSADYLLADRGYDTQDILDQAKCQGMTPVIPPKKNRKNQREYDKDLYKIRHLVENAFLHLKRWRGIATPYAKNAASFMAAIHIRCSALWANIS